MANSFTGPCGESNASLTAPLPRPPQPISASRIVLSSPAWTHVIDAPATADVAVSAPARSRNLRRVIGCSWLGEGSGDWLLENSFIMFLRSLPSIRAQLSMSRPIGFLSSDLRLSPAQFGLL